MQMLMLKRFLHYRLISNYLLLLSICYFVSYSISCAQVNSSQIQYESQLGQPLFDVGIYKRLFKINDSLRVDIVIEAANDLLQFIKIGDSFIASVDITLSIKDKEGKNVKLLTQTFQKSVSNFEETNSRQKYFNATFTNFLKAGEYNLKVLLLDRESQRKEYLDRSFSVVDIKDNLDLSDLIITRTNQFDRINKQPFDIAIKGTMPDSTGNLYLFFDIKRSDPLKVATIFISLYNQSNVQLKYDSLSIVGGELVSTYSLPIYCSNLSFGQYELVVKAKVDEWQVIRKTTIRINPYGLPYTICNIDQAIQQLRYIATNEEIQRLLRAFPSEREAEFIKFWNDNFPTENEMVNGKMVEYYNRVYYATENFSNMRQGWETDRGRIYIVYGSPSEVERRTNDTNGITYEIWYYHHLNRQFVFQDDIGFGDYKLISPMW